MPHQAAYLTARQGPACVRNVCIHVCGLRTLFDGIRSSPLLFSIRKVIIIDASHIRRNALVVQWIGQRFPVPPMQVRFLSEAPDTKSLFPNVRTCPRIAKRSCGTPWETGFSPSLGGTGRWCVYLNIRFTPS